MEVENYQSPAFHVLSPAGWTSLSTNTNEHHTLLLTGIVPDWGPGFPPWIPEGFSSQVNRAIMLAATFLQQQSKVIENLGTLSTSPFTLVIWNTSAVWIWPVCKEMNFFFPFFLVWKLFKAWEIFWRHKMVIPAAGNLREGINHGSGGVKKKKS